MLYLQDISAIITSFCIMHRNSQDFSCKIGSRHLQSVVL